jgi:DNA-binding MarR family transcriptional regulator
MTLLRQGSAGQALRGSARSDAGLTLDAYLPYRLSVASNAVSGLIARAYQDRFGLSVPQWRLICVLAEGGALTQGQLVSKTVMDKVMVSRATQGLLRRHLVSRTAHHADARSHVLALSTQGQRLYAEIAPLALAYEQALIAGLSPEEVDGLKRLLSRLQSAATALVDHRRLRPDAPPMRALAERQMKAVGRPPALIAPVLLEGVDEGFLQILGDLSDVVAHGAGHLFNHQRAVRFAAERQEDLTYALGEGLLAHRRHFAGQRVGGVFEVLSHDKADFCTSSFSGRLRLKANSWLMQLLVVSGPIPARRTVP